MLDAACNEHQLMFYMYLVVADNLIGCLVGWLIGWLVGIIKGKGVLSKHLANFLSLSRIHVFLSNNRSCLLLTLYT